MKLLREFCETGSEESKEYIIGVSAYNLDEDEHMQVRKFIEQHNGSFSYIDADSMHAEFRLDNYDDAMNLLKTMEKNGWSWR